MNLSVYACDERARARASGADLARSGGKWGLRSRPHLVVESVLINYVVLKHLNVLRCQD